MIKITRAMMLMLGLPVVGCATNPSDVGADNTPTVKQPLEPAASAVEAASALNKDRTQLSELRQEVIDAVVSLRDMLVVVGPGPYVVEFGRTEDYTGASRDAFDRFRQLVQREFVEMGARHGVTFLTDAARGARSDYRLSMSALPISRREGSPEWLVRLQVTSTTRLVSGRPLVWEDQFVIPVPAWVTGTKPGS